MLRKIAPRHRNGHLLPVIDMLLYRSTGQERIRKWVQGRTTKTCGCIAPRIREVYNIIKATTSRGNAGRRSHSAGAHRFRGSPATRQSHVEHMTSSRHVDVENTLVWDATGIGRLIAAQIGVHLLRILEHSWQAGPGHLRCRTPGPLLRLSAPARAPAGC